MLSFDRMSLPAVFPESTLVGDGKALLSLEYVLLQRAVVDDDDRRTLTTFLAPSCVLRKATGYTHDR